MIVFCTEFEWNYVRMLIGKLVKWAIQMNPYLFCYVLKDTFGESKASIIQAHTHTIEIVGSMKIKENRTR